MLIMIPPLLSLHFKLFIPQRFFCFFLTEKMQICKPSPFSQQRHWTKPRSGRRLLPPSVSSHVLFCGLFEIVDVNINHWHKPTQRRQRWTQRLFCRCAPKLFIFSMDFGAGDLSVLISSHSFLWPNASFSLEYFWDVPCIGRFYLEHSGTGWRKRHFSFLSFRLAVTYQRLCCVCGRTSSNSSRLCCSCFFNADHCLA